MKWKAVIAKLNQLIGGSGNRAWEIACNVRLLWKDKEFLQEACDNRLSQAEELLAQYADATGYHLNDLLQMIEHFPEQAEWKDGKLRHLYDATCRLIASKRAKAATKVASEKECKPLPKQSPVSIPEVDAPVEALPSGVQSEVRGIAPKMVSLDAYNELLRKYRHAQAEIRRLRKQLEAKSFAQLASH